MSVTGRCVCVCLRVCTCLVCVCAWWTCDCHWFYIFHRGACDSRAFSSSKVSVVRVSVLLCVPPSRHRANAPPRSSCDSAFESPRHRRSNGGTSPGLYHAKTFLVLLLPTFPRGTPAAKRPKRLFKKSKQETHNFFCVIFNWIVFPRSLRTSTFLNFFLLFSFFKFFFQEGGNEFSENRGAISARLSGAAELLSISACTHGCISRAFCISESCRFERGAAAGRGEMSPLVF